MFAVLGMVPTKVNAGAGATMNCIDLVAVRALGLPESFTLKATFVVPAAEAGGIPVIWPDDDKEIPFGSALPDATAQV